MKDSSLRIGTLLFGAALALVLGACGGGGGSASAGLGKSTQPTAQPTASGRPYQVHIVIGFSGQRTTETVPGNGNNAAVLSRGASDGGPLAGARITYPDNSDQYADANGVFIPSASSYAQKNQKLLQTNPNAQPLVIISDPLGKARPSTARVAAYVAAPVATALVVRSTKSASLGTINNLAGVSLLQPTSSIFSSDVLNLDVQGSDLHDNVVDLTTAQISYTASLGTVAQIPGTTEAYYLPPDVPSGSVSDSITVNVTVPNTTTQFSSSNSVLVVSAASAIAVGGTVQNAAGTAMPGSIALFAQLSKYFPPNYWLAAADNSGAYAADVPASELFNLVVGAPAVFSPSGNFDFFVGSTDAGGAVTSFNSGSAPTASLNVFLPASPIFFNNAPSGALPSFVGFVRDAWYNTVDASTLRIFEAGSGLQPLLAAVPASFPSPALPSPVGTGQLATWCYQWEQVSGVPTLVVAEAEGPNCTQTGNDGFTITPAGGGTFNYVKYTSNTSFAFTSPLDVVTNTQLVESGSWQQSLTGAPSAIASDVASVNAQLYDSANQVLGSSVYNESLQYAYALDGSGFSSEQFTNDTRTAASDGSLVAVYNATKTQTAALSSCQATAAQCFTVGGTVAENFDPSSGTFTSNYTINSTINGDGSALLTYQSAGDASKVVIPLASNAQSNTSPYYLVNSGAPGRVYDVDGTSQIGSFTVNNGRLVQFLVLDPTQGGIQVDSLGFIL